MSGCTFYISPDVEEVVGQKKLGSFTSFFSEVNGTVFELNEKFLLIKDFNYDGKGRAPIFLAGTTGTPGGDGEVRIHLGKSIIHMLALAGALYVTIDLIVKKGTQNHTSYL